MSEQAKLDDELMTAEAWMKSGKEVAIATVVSTWGSAPRPSGSHLVIDEDGNFEGSVSGGCVEGAVVAEAMDVISSGEPKLLEFGVKSSVVQIDGVEFFLNTNLPPARIIVIGAVHITQAMAPIAKMAGYDLQVIDPRTAFATKERFAGTSIYAEWPDEVLKNHPLDPYCALAAVTHDPKIDDFPIAEALRQNCFYVGALGSRKTHAKRVDRLLAEGITQEQIDHIKAPIGLHRSFSQARIGLSNEIWYLRFAQFQRRHPRA